MCNKGLNDLYDIYPALYEINAKNNIISKNVIIKTLFTEEQLSAYASNCPGFLFVINGKINIKRINEDGEETHLYFIEKGEICHETLSCYLKCKPLKIVGTAVQDSLIAIVPFEIVRKELLENAEFLKYIYIDLHSKLNKIIDNKEQVKHEPIEKRVIKYLLEKKSKVIYGTHSEIAFELDTAREVVSRKLKELEKKGFIQLSRGKIQVIGNLKELLNDLKFY